MSPRYRNAAATRDAMLQAARRRFLQESYEQVALREIAGDVGVDVALVGRYFGSKEALFVQVLQGGKSKEWPVAPLSADALAAWLAGLAVSEEKGRDDLERLLIILRSVSSPKAAELVRDSFREDVLEPLATLIDGPDAEMRASLALSILIGMTVMRTILTVEPLTCCDCSHIQPKLTQLFETVLTNDPAVLPVV